MLKRYNGFYLVVNYAIDGKKEKHANIFFFWQTFSCIDSKDEWFHGEIFVDFIDANEIWIFMIPVTYMNQKQYARLESWRSVRWIPRH